MTKQKTFSIIKQNHELLKIIPMGNEDEVEFKIIIRANISHYYWQCNYMCVRSEGAITCITDIFKNDFKDFIAEYSYHRTNGKNPVKIHLKLLIDDKALYFTPEFKNLIEPNTTQLLPVPFCRIACHNPMDFPEFHSKNTKVSCDISAAIEHNILEHNVVEIYMLGNHCSDIMGKFEKKWQLFYLIASKLSIEHFAVPNRQHMEAKQEGMRKSNIMKSLSFPLNNNVSFWICTYYNEIVATDPDATSFSLIENGDYLKVIACTPIQFRDQISGRLSEKKFAYEWQLMDNKNILTPIEYSFWDKKFQGYAKEYKKKEIRLPGMIIPGFIPKSFK